MNRRVGILMTAGAAAGVLFVGPASAQNLDVKGTTTGEGNAYFYQNVGVGTTTPGKRLTLSTSNTNDGLQVMGNSSQSAALLTNLGAGSYNPIVAAGDQGIIYGGTLIPQGGFVIAPWLAGGVNVPSGLRLDAIGNVGIGTTASSTRLAVNGSGANVYGTDVWVENNIHVQGNEGLVQGGRGRLRLGTAWGYPGLYAERSSANAVVDLILGASSGQVRVGCDSCGSQSLVVNGSVQQKLRDVANGTVNGHSLTFTGWAGLNSPPYIEARVDGTYVGINIFWSSRRFKNNIRDLQLDMHKINMLRPVEFEWNEKTVPAKGKSIGLIAEEVYGVFPELVVMREGVPWSVNYELLSVVLLAELKAQLQEAVATRAQLKSQQAEIDELKRGMRDLQAKSR